MATYKDLEEIGSGGFCRVIKCQRIQDGKTLAKKVLLHKDPRSVRLIRDRHLF